MGLFFLIGAVIIGSIDMKVAREQALSAVGDRNADSQNELKNTTKYKDGLYNEDGENSVSRIVELSNREPQEGL